MIGTPKGSTPHMARCTMTGPVTLRTAVAGPAEAGAGARRRIHIGLGRGADGPCPETRAGYTARHSMSSAPPPPHPGQPHGLIRQFGLLQATALNMSNMIGIGPFITIPLLMTALGGPQAMLGWLVALVIVIADGLIWSELGAAMPGSGGTYQYLREGFGREKVGRLMAFLFIWQFILSGPLEIASGYIGFAQYARYFWPGMSRTYVIAIAMAVGVVNIALLYRRIESVGRLTVTLWIGTLLTTLAVIVSGALLFPAGAWPSTSRQGAFTFSLGFLLGLGAAARVGIYDYLGYYDICYIGDEVRNPGHVIPRSIIISVFAVAVIYIAINLSIIGVVSVARVRAGLGQPAVRLHRVGVHGAAVRHVGRQRVHAAGAVDGVRIGLRAAARLLAHSRTRPRSTARSSGSSAGSTRRSTSRTSRC